MGFTPNNSFHHGEEASTWHVKQLFKIFHESPSRRADYENISSAGESEYPL